MVARADYEPNKVRRIEAWVDRGLEPLYPVLGSLSSQGSPRLQYHVSRGWNLDGNYQRVAVPAMPKSPEKPQKKRRSRKRKAEPNIEVKDPKYFLSAANAVLTMPYSAAGTEQGECPDSDQAILWRDAFLDNWFKHNDFILENALRFDEHHWLSDLMQYTQSRSHVEPLQNRKVAWYLPKYSNLIKEGKIFKRDIDQIRSLVEAYDQGKLNAINTFRVWLWGYKDLLQYYDAVKVTQEGESVIKGYFDIKRQQELGTAKRFQNAPQLTTEDELNRYKDTRVKAFKQFSEQVLNELKIDFVFDTGFRYIAPTLKRMIDQYKDRILEELAAQKTEVLYDEYEALKAEVDELYINFASQWDELLQDDNVKSLQEYRDSVYNPLINLVQSRYDVANKPNFAILRGIIDPEAPVDEIEPRSDVVCKVRDQIKDEALTRLQETEDRFAKLDAAWTEQQNQLQVSCEAAFNNYGKYIVAACDDVKKYDLAKIYMKTAFEEVNRSLLEDQGLSDLEKSYSQYRYDQLKSYHQAWSEKLAVLNSVSIPLLGYAKKCHETVSKLEQQESGKFQYNKTIQELENLEYPVDVPASIKIEFESLADAIYNEALARADWFCPGFKKVLAEFQEQLRLSLVILDPNQESKNMVMDTSINKLYRDLIDKYTPDEQSLARMGNNAKMYCTARLEMIESRYDNWLRLSEKSPYIEGMKTAFDLKVQALNESIAVTKEDRDLLILELATVAAKMNVEGPEEIQPIVEMLKQHYIAEYDVLAVERKHQLAEQNVNARVGAKVAGNINFIGRGCNASNDGANSRVKAEGEEYVAAAVAAASTS